MAAPWQVINPRSRVKAVHAVLLPRGDHGEIVYLFGAGDRRTCIFRITPFAGGDAPPYTDDSILEIPASLAPQSEPGNNGIYNLFCTGHAFLPDGRVLFAGGHLEIYDENGVYIAPPPGDEGYHGHGAGMAWGGDRRAAIFNPRTELSGGVWSPEPWVMAESMHLDPDNRENTGGRWYPQLVTLGNGEVLASGGHPTKVGQPPTDTEGELRHSTNIPERYSPWRDEWTLLASSPPLEQEKTADDLDGGAFDYERIHVTPNGKVFFVSPIRRDVPAVSSNRYYDPYRGRVDDQPVIAPREFPYDAVGVVMTSVMLPLLHQEEYRARIVITGGVRAYRIDLGASGTPTWTQTGARTGGDNAPRRENMNAVMLPTGQVFVCGGRNAAQEGVLEAELYDPDIDWETGAYGASQGSWTTLEPAEVLRGYHSTALLMTDGRVWTAGTDGPTSEGAADELRIELYPPSYIFASGRPVITEVIPEAPGPAGPTSGAGRVSYGVTFRVRTGTGQANNINRVALIRCGSVTHGFNSGQLYLSVPFTVEDGETLRVTAPPDGNVAPPGFYMVWIVDDGGLPCEEAKFIHIGHRRCVLHTDRSELSRDEVEALKQQEAGLLPWSILVRLEGFSPQEVGVSQASQLNDPSEAVLEGFAPVVTFALPDGLGSVSATPYRLEAEDSGTIDRVQRLTFWYRLDVNQLTLPDDPGFFEPVTLEAHPPDGVDDDLYACTGSFVFKAVATPYVLDGATPWLSTDLRVFTRRVADVGDPNAFITTLVQDYNDSGPTNHPFDALSEDPEVSQLFISQNDNEQQPVYNFAVARVRYRSSTALVAGDARVFFRMFDWQTTSMEFDENTTYRHANDVVPLLGYSPNDGNEVVSVPFFSVARTAGDMAGQAPDPAPGFEGNQLEDRQYYGVWLDFNQTTPRFPRTLASTSDNGPFGNAVSIMELVRNDHPCVVAEIVVATDNIEPGATPEGSERLTQRNITIVSSNNPGGPAAHTVQTTFDIKLSQDHATSPGLATHAARPDELVLSLAELPSGATATVYLPSIRASEVLRLTAAHGGRSYLVVDEYTISLPVGGTVYLALPGEPGDRIAGLLTVTLPDGISVGQTYRVVARQLSHRRQRVEGTFELLIPVKSVADNIRIDGRRLSVWRHIFSNMPTSDRGYPIFVRLLRQLEDRLIAVGVDPGLVKPSPAGDGLFRPTFEDSPITGNGEVLLADGVRVLTQAGGFAPVFNSGLFQLNVGVETDVGHLVARGLVFVRDRGRVHGFLRTSGELLQHNATQIDGPIVLGGSVFLPQLIFTVAFPAATSGDVALEPDQAGATAPGYYGKIAVKSRATLSLSSGTYFCNELTLEPEGKVMLNAAQGPIYIWVRDSFTFRGAFEDTLGAFPNVLVGYMGSGTATVDSLYRGTLLAPNGKITLATVALPGHAGSFHGKNVEIRPHTTVTHHPFSVPLESLPGTQWPPAGQPPPGETGGGAHPVLGFEDVTKWSSPQAQLSVASSPVTNGSSSLKVNSPPGWTEIQSVPFSSAGLGAPTARVRLDLWIPPNQPNPFWVGQLQMVVSAPSAGVYSAYVGQAELTGLPHSTFSTIELTLPSQVAAVINSVHADVSIKIVLNVNNGSGPYYLDNARFL
jgi:hypothetical protein